MPKECATTVTTDTAEPKNHGIVPMINCMLMACVRIATSTLTTEKGDSRNCRIRLKARQRIR